MYRIDWTLKTGERREHYCSSRDEALSVWNNLTMEPGVLKVLVYEHYGVGRQTGWKLITMASDGEAVVE